MLYIEHEKDFKHPNWTENQGVWVLYEDGRAVDYDKSFLPLRKIKAEVEYKIEGCAK